VLDNNHVGDNIEYEKSFSGGTPEWKKSFGIPKQQRENNSQVILKK
jgi:hypothetical protein